MRTSNGALSVPWSSEAAEPVIAGIPSWIAPRRASLVPLVFPRSAAPPAITTARESMSAPALRSSLRPSAPCIPTVAPLIAPMIAPYPDLREENALLRAELGAALAAMATMRSEILEASEPEVVALACAVAERAVGHALESDRELVVAWAHDALSVLASNEGVVVAIAPDLVSSIPSEAWARLGVPCRIEVDASLAAAHCEVRCGSGRVEVGATQRLGCIADELGVVRP